MKSPMYQPVSLMSRRLARLMPGLLATSAVVFTPMSASAQHTWTGSTSKYWDISDNWNPATTPNGDDVTNSTGQLIEYRTLVSTILSFATNGEFDLTGGNLTINGNLTLNAGGSLVMNGGTLTNATIQSDSLSNVTIKSSTANLWDHVTLAGSNPTLNIGDPTGSTAYNGFLRLNSLIYTGTLTANVGGGSYLLFDNGGDVKNLNFNSVGTNTFLGIGNVNGSASTLTLENSVNITGQSVGFG